jgi:hypothetical protein
MEEDMSQMELTYAKKCALATRDWDTFQAILRKCLKPPMAELVAKTRREAAAQSQIRR